MFEASNFVTLPDWVAGVCLFLAIGIAFVTGLKRPECTVRSPIVSTLVLLSAGFVLGVHANQSLGTQHADTKDKTFREEAWARFKKLCNENAGEKIYRTVDNVEGIFLAKPRQRPTEVQLRDQFWMGDPYGHDSDAQSEMVAYLADLDTNGMPVVYRTPVPGYRFVEIPGQAHGVIQYRREDPKRPPTQHHLKQVTARYEVRWEDISTREDRAYWIAGGRLRVIDRSTNEVLAERVGYLFEAGFGSRSGGRRPWLYARLYYGKFACPPFRRHAFINREFVQSVLKPIRGASNGR